MHEDVCHAPLLGAVFLKDAGVCAGGDGRQAEEGDPQWSDSSSLYFLSHEQASLVRIHECCWWRVSGGSGGARLEGGEGGGVVALACG